MGALHTRAACQYLKKRRPAMVKVVALVACVLGKSGSVVLQPILTWKSGGVVLCV